jgi:molecular chaperone HtpG
VSNGADAIAKYKLLALKGDARRRRTTAVDVVVSEAGGTLKIIDKRRGHDRRRSQALYRPGGFFRREEFLKQYKTEGEDGGIIGQFRGLGFYSAFMVSSKVVIDTKSWQPGAEAVRWISEDGMKYKMEPSDRAERGTTITLTISEEEHEFLHLHKLRETLEKYCAFMPVPIYLREDKPESEKAEEAPKQDHEGGEADENAAEKAPEQPVNDTHPLWNVRPADVTEAQYKDFYRKVFHDYEEPLFWIHLNAEYPFNLKGILYFPRLKNEFSANEGVIKLYNKQVFVADNIGGHSGVSDAAQGRHRLPDLPLNVSRSFLQNDGYVKKMSAYITRKVADRLVSEFTGKRETYEKYWNDIHPFVKYGCIRDEKFYDRVKDAILFKTADGRYMTLAEYKDKNFTDTDKTVFYASDEKRQAQMVALYEAAGKDVVLLGTLIDNNFITSSNKRWATGSSSNALTAAWRA